MGKNPDELDELRMSAVGEAMNQMMGSAATSLSTMLKKDINISPPRLTKVNFATDSLDSYFKEYEDIVTTSFSMEVGDFLQTEIMQLMPIPFAKTLVQHLYAISASDEPLPETGKAEPTKKSEEIFDRIPNQEVVASASEFQPSKSEGNKVTVNPVEFQVFKQEPIDIKRSSLELILDVPLEVTVELGRTTKTIKEILEISSGTILELDKMSGEPVDILVNGKLMAKGEVVVIDENFGVRITDIINSVDRVKSLQ